MKSNSSPEAQTFDKVLRAFETRGINYPDVISRLRQLLAKGASPSELLAVLRRRESHERLPEYAGVEVLLLQEVEMERETASADASVAPEFADEVIVELEAESAGAELRTLREALVERDAALEQLRPALDAVRAALEAEQHKARELEFALAQSIASGQAEREAALRDAERSQAELRGLNETLAEGEVAAEQTRLLLEQRASGLAADLDAARTALEAEQLKTRELQSALAHSTASEQAAREAALQAAEQTQAERRALRESLAERDVALDHLRQALERRANGLAADVDAARTALEAEQLKTRELESALAQSTASGQAAREAARQAAEQTHEEMRKLRESLAERDVALDHMRQALRLRDARIEESAVEARNTATLRLRAGEAAAAILETQTNRRGTGGPELPPARKPGVPTRGAPVRTLGWIAVAVLLAVIAALYVHRPAPAPTPASSAALPDPGTLIRDCPVCPEMKVLPGGRFKQGAADGYASARVVHWVAIRHPIAMSTNPATVDDFRQFVAATGRDMHGCDTYDGQWKARPDAAWDRPGFSQTGEEPVTCVSWNDAEAYAKWLSTRTGHHYRLPSASEWEYAARAGTEVASPWAPDDRAACASANVADASAGRRYPGWTVFPCDDGYVYTAPVGAFKANPFGIDDMLGNVLQWTDDCWHDNYVGAPIDGSAWVDGDCSQHEIRGASWFSAPSHVRVDYRDRFPSDYRTSSIGIRLVREIDP